MSAEKPTNITPDQLPRGPHRPVEAAPPAWTYRNLPAEEQAKHDRVLAHFSPSEGEYKLDEKPLDEAEKFWLSEECIQRYVRASKGVEETAKTRLEATLRWRREYGFDTEEMTPEHLSIEVSSCARKRPVLGFDIRSPQRLSNSHYSNTADLFTGRDRQTDYLRLRLCEPTRSLPPSLAPEH